MKPNEPRMGTGGWPAFEQRVRARRAARCVAMAREAVARGDLVAACEATDELAELVPGHPDLQALREAVTATFRSETPPPAPKVAVPPDVGLPQAPPWPPVVPEPRPRAQRAVPHQSVTRQVPVTPRVQRPPRRRAAVATAAAVVIMGVLTSQTPREAPFEPLEYAGLLPAAHPPVTGLLPDLVPLAVDEALVQAAPSDPQPSVPAAAAAVPPPAPARPAPAAPERVAAVRVEPATPSTSAPPTRSRPAPEPTLPPEPEVVSASAEAPPIPLVGAEARAVVNTPLLEAPEPRAVPTSGAAAIETPVAARPRVPDPESAVRDVLQRYVSAYNELDAGAAGAVWPAVDRAALQRAFAQLDSQTLRFDRCDIAVDSDGGTATCAGQARWVPRVGARDVRRESRTWRFELARDEDGWIITRAEARR